MSQTAHLIEIRDEAPKKYKISRAKIRTAATQILSALGWKQAGLSLWLVNDSKIRALNKRFMNHDWATDVISFSQWEGRKLNARGLSGQKKLIPLGDLIISLDTTARQAAEYGNSLYYEFCFYLCHGILHLMGHDDRTSRGAKQMERKQTALLKQIGIQ